MSAAFPEVPGGCHPRRKLQVEVTRGPPLGLLLLLLPFPALALALALPLALALALGDRGDQSAQRRKQG
eukprot:15436877-Alexandrium_andersonii.AAC.1